MNSAASRAGGGSWPLRRTNPDTRRSVGGGRAVHQQQAGGRLAQLLAQRRAPQCDHVSTRTSPGEYTLYYPSGRTEETGTWDYDRNTGTFKRWHPNGKLAQEFVFDEHGMRDGQQKYYHDNGQLAVDVTIRQGREEGTFEALLHQRRPSTGRRVQWGDQ